MEGGWLGRTSFPRARVIPVAIVVVLIAISATLPYFTLHYFDFASKPVTRTERVFGADRLIGGLDPTYLPGYQRSRLADLSLALNVLGAAPLMQWASSLAAVLTVAGQFFDEINRFLWWPLHLTGYLLIIGPIMLFAGLSMLRAQGVPIILGPSWVAAAAAGVCILVITFRSWHRIDR